MIFRFFLLCSIVCGTAQPLRAMDALWACKDYVVSFFHHQANCDQTNSFTALAKDCPQAHARITNAYDYSDSCYRYAVSRSVEEAFLVKLYILQYPHQARLKRHGIWSYQIDQNMTVLRTVLSDEQYAIVHKHAVDFAASIQQSNHDYFRKLYQWASHDGSLESCCSRHMHEKIIECAQVWHQQVAKQ